MNLSRILTPYHCTEPRILTAYIPDQQTGYRGQDTGGRLVQQGVPGAAECHGESEVFRAASRNKDVQPSGEFDDAGFSELGGQSDRRGVQGMGEGVGRLHRSAERSVEVARGVVSVADGCVQQARVRSDVFQ